MSVAVHLRKSFRSMLLDVELERRAAFEEADLPALHCWSKTSNDLGSVLALSDVDLIRFTAFAVASKSKPSGYLLPRKQVFRNNYDYGEGWPTMMDDFRSGKIKGVRDFIEKKRNDPPVIKDLYEGDAGNKKKAGKSGKKKKKERAGLAFDPLLFDSYCKQKSKYWKKNRKSPSDAVEDFIEYSESVDCYQ